MSRWLEVAVDEKFVHVFIAKAGSTLVNASNRLFGDAVLFAVQCVNSGAMDNDRCASNCSNIDLSCKSLQLSVPVYILAKGIIWLGWLALAGFIANNEESKSTMASRATGGVDGGLGGRVVT